MIDTPSRQALAAQQRSAPGQVTGRLRTALLAMVWSAARRDEAATIAGMTDHSLRSALRKPHVARFLLQEMEVRRLSERPANISALVEIRDKAEGGNQMARVAAVRALEEQPDIAPLGGAERQRAPGVVIVIQNGPAPAINTAIDITPINITPPRQGGNHDDYRPYSRGFARGAQRRPNIRHGLRWACEGARASAPARGGGAIP